MPSERKRKPLSMGDKIRVLQRQALCQRCGALLGDGPVAWDHVELFALDGPDEWQNFQAIHVECHHIKTFGTHVPLSGDISVIAKTKRLTKKEEAFRARLLARANPTEGSPCRKSRWPKGRKIARRPKG
jgi:hypothetical protein